MAVSLSNGSNTAIAYYTLEAVTEKFCIFKFFTCNIKK